LQTREGYFAESVSGINIKDWLDFLVSASKFRK
jgi:hypothetical protein